MQTQTLRIEIESLPDTIRHALFWLRLETVKVRNWCMTQYFNHEEQRKAFQAQHGRFPTNKEMPFPYLYPELRNLYPEINTATLTGCINAAKLRWQNSRKSVCYLHTESLPTFRKTNPISIQNQSYKLLRENNRWQIEFPIISRKGKETEATQHFPMRVRANLRTKKMKRCQKLILERIHSGEYKKCELKLQEKRGKWFALIPYQFEKKSELTDTGDNRKPLFVGVDLGAAFPAVMAEEKGKWRSFLPDFGLFQWRTKIRKQRRSYQTAGRVGTDVRSGRGRKKKLQPIEKLREKERNFSRLCNWRWAKFIVHEARRRGATHLVIEELEGIAEKNLKLKDWTYHQLEEKIKYIAKRDTNIKVIVVSPKYTSQRCSECGTIDANNRSEDFHRFKCLRCGFSGNAHWNAARNIAQLGRIVTVENGNGDWTKETPEVQQILDFANTFSSERTPLLKTEKCSAVHAE